MNRFVVGLALVELGVIAACACVGWLSRNELNGYFDQSVPDQIAVGQITMIVLIWFGVLVVQRVYSREVVSVGYGEYALVLRSSLFALGGVGFVAYFTKIYIARGFLVITFALGILLLVVIRYSAHRLLAVMRTRGRLRHRAIVVGPPAALADLLRIFRREAWTGYGVVGACVPEGASEGWAHDVPVLGFIGELAEVVRRERADTVVVMGGSYRSPHDLRRVGWALEGQSVDLLVAPTLTDVAGPRVRMRNVAGLPLVHVAEPSIGQATGLVKRVFDVVAAGTVLLLISPLMMAIAIAIKVHDRGPIFYRQTRVGATGTHFSMIKFRSMVVNADDVRSELGTRNEHDGVLFKIKQDPRITPVGRVLRRYSLDELPQLFNVLKGTMSLVGPRPALPSEVENYGSDMHRRLLVQPGLTGLWQVSGRSDLSWEDSVRLDLYYVDNWSMLGDAVILAKTVRAVLTSNGAY